MEYYQDIADVLMQLLSAPGLPPAPRLRALLTAVEMLRGQVRFPAVIWCARGWFEEGEGEEGRARSTAEAVKMLRGQVRLSWVEACLECAAAAA